MRQVLGGERRYTWHVRVAVSWNIASQPSAYSLAHHDAHALRVTSYFCVEGASVGAKSTNFKLSVTPSEHVSADASTATHSPHRRRTCVFNTILSVGENSENHTRAVGMT